MSLRQLDAITFEEKIYGNEETCLIIFSRKSCHVCKQVVPVLEELQPKYEGKFGFYYVDTEENISLFQRFSTSTAANSVANKPVSLMRKKLKEKLLQSWKRKRREVEWKWKTPSNLMT